jgi:flavodoxin I
MSTKIGLFYGTTTGETESVAGMIRDAFGSDVVTLHDISQANANDFHNYKYIIIGCPTFDAGDLQSDWESFFDELDNIDFTGKQVAYFGNDDQNNYPQTFQDAIGILEERISELGGQTIGYTSTHRYLIEDSKALREEGFCGLALDEENQSHLTEERIISWVNQLNQEFSL